MPYVERVTKAGNTIEIERYFTSRYKKKGISRGDKVKPTKEEQEKVNTRQAERKLRILINANYGYGDYHLVLDYIRRKGEPDRTPEQMRQDMEDIIGLENKEKLIGSAVKVGMVGDVFYGVPQGIYMESVIVHEDSIKENTWTHEQFMDSVLAGDIYPCIKIGNSLCSSQISFKLITRLNLTDSFFIDWEKRQSRFASDDVKRFIETFGDYELTSIDDVDVDKKKTYQIGGVSRGNIHDEDSYQDYLEYLEKSGYKYIGYPTSQGNGNYLHDEGVIVVNVNTIHKEEVRELIEAFLGDEVQSLKYIGDDYVSVTGYGIEDFIPYLEMCVPFPAENTVIQNIVFEELEPYFEHDKTLEQALKLIDSRVQIYLDETE